MLIIHKIYRFWSSPFYYTSIHIYNAPVLYQVQKHPLQVLNVLLFESVFNSLHLPVYRCVSYVVLSPAAVLHCAPQVLMLQG